MSSTPIEDYYAVLGVPREIGAAELRRTYRKLALRYHPDRAGIGSTAAFQQIARAYEVLSDPKARESYDRRLRSEERTKGPTSDVTTPSTPSPARSEAPPAPPPAARKPRTLLTRLSGPLNSLIACGTARKCEDGTIELHLSEEDSREGGYATISTYSRVSCRACSGSAQSRASCPQCKGEGTVTELVSAWLTIPPHAPDGILLTVSIGPRMAAPPFRFRIRTESAVAVG
jgi:DnaJ-class molecular chaperone